jgi:hypothetical protein
MRKSEAYVVTGVPLLSQSRRRNRYMALMFLRVLMVPGVLLLPVPGSAQAALVVIAALTQLVTVIITNEPIDGTYNNPSAYSPPRGELTDTP